MKLLISSEAMHSAALGKSNRTFNQLELGWKIWKGQPGGLRIPRPSYGDGRAETIRPAQARAASVAGCYASRDETIVPGARRRVTIAAAKLRHLGEDVSRSD